MKLRLFIITILLALGPSWLSAQDDVTRSDSVSVSSAVFTGPLRPITSSLELHLGSGSARNTYLAPLLYSGPELGVYYERARRWRALDWMSLQSMSGQFLMGDDKGQHSSDWSGRFRYRYAALYGFDLYYLMLMAGPSLGVEVGFDYNLKMAASNNPATARAAVNMGVTLMGAMHYRWLRRSNVAFLQVQMPLLGYALMPEYGASYYESFSLGVVDNLHHFTSLHNQQDFDLRLCTDVQLTARRGGILRLGMAYRIETMQINLTTTRFSAFEAILGWTFHSLPYNARKVHLSKQSAYEAY